MAKTDRLSMDEPEEFDEFLAGAERPGIADGIEWFFANSFAMLLLIITPWNWFRRQEEYPEAETEFSSSRGRSVMWRLMNAFEQVSAWFGEMFGYLIDSIELFFINVFATVRRLLRIR